jgi:hypothetical protein
MNAAPKLSNSYDLYAVVRTLHIVGTGDVDTTIRTALDSGEQTRHSRIALDTKEYTYEDIT